MAVTGLWWGRQRWPFRLAGAVWAALAGGDPAAPERVPLSNEAVDVCRVYLEQNALILQAFGHLRQARWLADQAYACRERAHGGRTRGAYAFALMGTQAEGQVTVVWVREPGPEGCLEVPEVQVIEHRALQGAPASRTGTLAAPTAGGL